jgi:hypothetical protein
MQICDELMYNYSPGAWLSSLAKNMRAVMMLGFISSEHADL